MTDLRGIPPARRGRTKYQLSDEGLNRLYEASDGKCVKRVFVEREDLAAILKDYAKMCDMIGDEE